jgi:pimeloyl-ACP methyl ester carboxylesterase
VLFDGAYGQMLRHAETYLNNMIAKGQVHEMWAPLFCDPRDFGASSGNALTEQDIRKIAPCWYPVHAMGYNFLKSNGESAKVIAGRLRGLVHGYQQRGFKCDEVIVVTHSMGGLVARALMHPKYGNLLDGPVRVLGIYHNVMPTMGAAAAYKRMRFGFLEKVGFLKQIPAELQARILGIDGRHATAILANTPGPLELLPGAAYGKDWLKVVDGCGRTMCSWPGGDTSALDDIYRQSDKAWWRLVNPEWVNPAHLAEKFGTGIENVFKRIRAAVEFGESIKATFHPTGSYASFCSSAEHLSYGEIVFKVIDREVWDARHISLPSPDKWQLLSDDTKGTLKVQAGHRVLTLELQEPVDHGDETVPSLRSAEQIAGTLFLHGKQKRTGYEHQDSYSDPAVLASMLYSIVQMAKAAKWD